jgi:AcrR family transcriptional regulator
MSAELRAPLRSDARRNLDQILAAAKELFAEQGAQVPMEEIARRASVGVGTLYRRFPDRVALIRAVAQTTFVGVVAGTKAAIAEEPTAWDALGRILRQSAELRLSMRLMASSPTAIAVIKADPEVARCRRELVELLDGVVRAAQAEGTLRRDVGAADVALMAAATLHPTRGLSEDAAEQIPDRMLVVLLDGLRAGRSSRLPGRPITLSDLDY